MTPSEHADIRALAARTDLTPAAQAWLLVVLRREHMSLSDTDRARLNGLRRRYIECDPRRDWRKG